MPDLFQALPLEQIHDLTTTLGKNLEMKSVSSDQPLLESIWKT